MCATPRRGSRLHGDSCFAPLPAPRSPRPGQVPDRAGRPAQASWAASCPRAGREAGAPAGTQAPSRQLPHAPRPEVDAAGQEGWVGAGSGHPASPRASRGAEPAVYPPPRPPAGATGRWAGGLCHRWAGPGARPALLVPRQPSRCEEGFGSPGGVSGCVGAAASGILGVTASGSVGPLGTPQQVGV